MRKNIALKMLAPMLFLSILYFAFAKVEINCSVFLFGENDWIMTGVNSHCIEEVARVRQYCGGSKINFVPTQFFVDTNSDTIPEYFATKSGLEYYTINKTNIANFEKGLVNCFNFATISGFKTIEITPHLDDGTGGSEWRNAVVMNPLARYDGVYSYYDIMINPIVVALSKVYTNNPNINIYLALEGEMNLMLISYPDKWLKMLNVIRCMLPSGSKVGVSVNFNKLCGMNYCDQNKIKQYNIPAIQNLFTSIDFLGMSSYPSINNIQNLQEFQNGVFALSDEFKLFGLDISQFPDNGIEIHFSEFGIGGSTCAGNEFPATNISHITQCPYFGVFGPYSLKTDPWKSSQMKGFQIYYYKQLSRWVSQGTGPTFKVNAIYLWNVASWDVTGIYHESSSVEGSYRNYDVVSLLKSFNDDNVVP